jgi:aminoglycoside phosphotransferase (APT) family kinase protein
VHRIELADGRVLGVKQYAVGKHYAVEGAALRQVAGTVPAPQIVYTLDCVIAYRWIEGITLHECRRSDRAALARLAGPLGRLLGALAAMTRPAPRGARPPSEVSRALAQLDGPRVRSRLGAELAAALRERLAASPFEEPTCVSHGALDASHVIVAPGLDRIAGVVGWTAAGTGSILRDIASLVRDLGDDDAFLAEFARGHGGLAADWLARARLLGAAHTTAALDTDIEPAPAVIDGLRTEIARAVAHRST